MDGWEPEDDPLSEHQRRECPFVTLGKQQDEMSMEEAATLLVARAKALLVRVMSLQICIEILQQGLEYIRLEFLYIPSLYTSGKTDGGIRERI